jgi:hypothetical protein
LSGARVARSLVICVCFVYRCLIFSLYLLPLCCLSFFDLRILITPLVYSNYFSIDNWKHHVFIHFRTNLLTYPWPFVSYHHIYVPFVSYHHRYVLFVPHDHGYVPFVIDKSHVLTWCFVSTKRYTPYAGAAGMLLHINGKFTMGKSKSSLLS